MNIEPELIEIISELHDCTVRLTNITQALLNELLILKKENTPSS